MIIECVGLPGAGKSQVHRLLVEELQAAGWCLVDPLQTLKAVMRAGSEPRSGLSRLWSCYPMRGLRYARFRSQVAMCDIRNRITLSGAFRATLAPVPRAVCRWLAEDIVLIRAFRRWLRQQLPQPAAYAASEGLVHHCAALGAWTTDRHVGIGELWLSRNSCRDLHVVHVDVPVSVGVGRFLERGAPRSWPARVAGSESAVHQTIARFETAIDDSLERFTGAGATYYSVDNSDSAEQLAARVRDLAVTIVNHAKTETGCTARELTENALCAE